MTPVSNPSLPKATILQVRASMLARVRTFFAERQVMEVDTPLLSHYAPIDAHIDLFEVDLGSQTGYLHSSPEYAMKRLLADGLGDIYQLSHVYRKEELGALHNPVFTLLEWYRVNGEYQGFIQEIVDLIALFLGKQSLESLSYQAAFQKKLELDPLTASSEELIHVASLNNLELEEQDRDAMLNMLWGCLIEPHLGQGTLTLVTDYPKEQAALAQTTFKEGVEVAERFEVYWKGIELANGYHELRDSAEQKRRLISANNERRALGKDPLPIDPHFLKALDAGLPECYGVAVGFDRLLLLHLGLPSLEHVLPLPWNPK